MKNFEVKPSIKVVQKYDNISIAENAMGGVLAIV